MDPMSDYLQNSTPQEEEKKRGDSNHGNYDENDKKPQLMSQSFYKKEGLDFLYFNRPGTAYNDPSKFAGTQKGNEMMNMMGTQTRAAFFIG